MNKDITTFLKGFAMGAANVVPGVSGGTIAFITGIYERLINALKSFDVEALQMVLKFRFLDLAKKIDIRFLSALFLGVIVSIVTLAQVLKWGFEKHPTLIWALFFGLIAVSIPSIGKMVKHWTMSRWLCLIIGAALALSMAFLKPANENTAIVYLLLCGVVAMCSMIIPGLSGSFVLLLMGNYSLIMIDSVNALSAFDLGKALPVLIPVGIGAVIGLLALSHFLSWLFKNHHDNATATIAGFVAGSLVIIWPWKDKIVETFYRNDEAKEKIIGYENWHLPNFSQSSTWLEVACVIAGAALIIMVEKLAKKENV
nr:polyprenyl-phosphate transporter-like [Nerophis lumbriciformis]